MKDFITQAVERAKTRERNPNWTYVDHGLSELTQECDGNEIMNPVP